MRNLLLKRVGVIFALLIGITLGVRNNLGALPPKDPAEKLPKLVVDSEVYDLGEVWSGKGIKHAFVLENKGEDDLIIKHVSPG